MQSKHLAALTLIATAVATLTVGASPAHLHFATGATQQTLTRPIMTRSQVRRMCTELCVAGLGGPSCGDDCFDLAPEGLPVVTGDAAKAQQSGNGTGNSPYVGANTRHSACSVLCANGLGRPLCMCSKLDDDEGVQQQKGIYDTNFAEVCSYFCVHYEYQIFGCQSCSVFKYLNVRNKTGRSLLRPVRTTDTAVNWTSWCNQMCSTGDGGIACNCDILPMSRRLRIL